METAHLDVKVTELPSFSINLDSAQTLNCAKLLVGSSVPRSDRGDKIYRFIIIGDQIGKFYANNKNAFILRRPNIQHLFRT